MNKWWGRAAAAALLPALLAGCSFGGGGDVALKELGKDEQATIKVMFYDERNFYDQYGMLFTALHPNIAIEVASTNSIRFEEGGDYQKERKTFIEEQKPDVLLLSADEYETMAAEGKLYDLEPVIAQDKYDTENLLPGLIDYMKEKGGGKLYGMTPSFYSQAVYYNKDLFDKYGIPYPTDKMTWEDLLLLAQRFPADGSKEERVYGLKAGYGNGLMDLGGLIGQSQDLGIVSGDGSQVTVDTDGWRQAYETALGAIQSGALYTENQGATSSSSYEDYLLQDPFIGGRLAMTIDGMYLADQLKEAADYLKDNPKVAKNWALVTMPVNPANPDYSTSVGLSEIFAIDAQSPNARAAWDFIKYVTSDDFAKVTALANRGSLSVRTGHLKDEDNRNMAAYYALKPADSNMYGGADNVPQEFYGQYYSAAATELQEAQDGKKTVAEALQSLQASLQDELLKAKQKEESEPEPSGEAAAAGGSSGGAE